VGENKEEETEEKKGEWKQNRGSEKKNGNWTTSESKGKALETEERTDNRREK